MRHGGDIKTILPLQPPATSAQGDVPTADVPTALPEDKLLLLYLFTWVISGLLLLVLYSLSLHKMDVNAGYTNEALPDSTWSELPCITARLKSTTSTQEDPTKVWNTLTAGVRGGYFSPVNVYHNNHGQARLCQCWEKENGCVRADIFCMGVRRSWVKWVGLV